MRKVKFRGKLTKQNIEEIKRVKRFFPQEDYEEIIETEWVAGSLVSDTWIIGSFDVEDYDVLGLENWFLVKSKTVGQYTNQKDIKGDLVCEGDVINVAEEFGGGSYTPIVIEYSERDDRFQAYTVMNIDRKIGFDKISFNQYEIIGNIHDNPELLEV